MKRQPEPDKQFIQAGGPARQFIQAGLFQGLILWGVLIMLDVEGSLPTLWLVQHEVETKI